MENEKTKNKINKIMDNIFEDENLCIVRDALEYTENIEKIMPKMIKILNYMIEAEEKHFEECSKEEQADHIYKDVLEVLEALK